jgi:hypothetical protein
MVVYRNVQETKKYSTIVEKLVKALEYYADPATHYGGIDTGWVPIVDEDKNGNKAREALDAYREFVKTQK